MTISKEQRLKNFVRDKMKEALLVCGRDIVADQGIEALSARKLAVKANSSVGMIYGLFGTMDGFVSQLNVMTLQNLYEQMTKIVLGRNPFNNLNRYMDVLATFIALNPNLWHLLFTSQMTTKAQKSSIAEARIIKKIDILIGMQTAKLIKGLSGKEKRLSIKVLEMSLFALSGYLLGNKLNPKSGVNRGNLCKLLMNTYIAGLASLKKVK